MASAPLILDISSDDEPGGGLVGAPLDGGGDDFAWLSELLDADDKEPDSDSDEVVVVGEVINAKPKSKFSKLTVRDADDDCIVLEADPDKPVALVGDEVGGSDELLVVGEKGQVITRIGLSLQLRSIELSCGTVCTSSGCLGFTAGREKFSLIGLNSVTKVVVYI